jgi:hypothetical protein
MTTLQERERAIDESIVEQLVQATPEWWKAAVLKITRSTKPGGIEGFAHLITSPEGYRDVVQATDETFQLTMQLADLFTTFGKPWQQVVYSVSQSANGSWKYTADYGY